ncbi:MAG: murein biosynthesis integral membrane protein MurJ [Candidatus Peregrinibacteria bacterium]|nr:murein biosynthesis integral membrane protein MurJ [Candidatus Peregrinibacteria bacterium]MDZ4244400.1 murein biosynthesis integral membrane protein MurJ [Candidatus Gracilibacteria bacterium]
MTKSLLYKSAFILGFSSLLSRLLGVVRDHLLAGTFGAQGEGAFNLDVYYAAFRIPDFIYAILIMGAVSAAFVPVLTEVMHGKGKTLDEGGSLFVSNVLNVVLCAVILFGGIAFLFAPFIVRFLVPGFTGGDFPLTILVTRIMLVSPIFFGISAVLQAAQNTFDKFFYIAIAPIFYNIGIILGIYFFAQQYGVFAVAGGVIVGAFLNLLIQIPGVLALKFRYRPFVCLKDPYLRKMIRLVIPRILGMSVMQVNLIFDTLVGSLLATGSITILNYAVNLNSLPMGMVGISFAIASFATLSSMAVDIEKAGKPTLEFRKKFANHLGKIVVSILYFVVPAAVGLFVLRFQIVDVILGNGAFTDNDILLTGNTLAFFLIGLLGQSLIPVFARTFYAFKNTLTPVLISVSAMILNIGLNFYFALSLELGVYGIALATSLTSLLNMVLLVIFLRSKFLSGMQIFDLRRVGAILFAGIIMGIAVYFMNIYLIAFAEVSSLNQILALCASIVVGIIVFFCSILPFGLEETNYLLKKLFLKNVLHLRI